MKKSLDYLGVDLGGSGVKVVQLSSQNGRARLATYGFSQRPPQNITSSMDDTKAIAEELINVCQKAGVTTKQVVTGLPVAEVFSTIFSFSGMKDKELESAIKAKATKLSPIPAGDMVIDWKKIGEDKDNKDLTRVSVTVASKKLINNYLKIFKIAGLELVNLETEAFALIRSLLGKDKSPSFIVDIGSLKSNVLIVKEGVPFIHRSVKTGGKKLSELIASKLNLSEEKAEYVKKSLSIKKTDSTKVLLDNLLGPIIDEIKYSQEFYEQQYNHGVIEKIILTGGSSAFTGLPELLMEKTGFRTFLGDPWTRVLYPNELRPVLDKIGPKFSVAIGLSLRDMG